MCLETCVLNSLGWKLEDSQSLREMQNFRCFALNAIGVVGCRGACYAGKLVPDCRVFF